MGQQTLGGRDLTARRATYRRLVEKRLPAVATAEGWPITEDHCFARVVLDNVFEDEWYDHVAGRPAVDHLSASELDAAVGVAWRLLTEGRPLVEAYNRNSLRWRGER